uniref:DUF659 domain-containing protein n=1 Tax=Lactuca sativa TaxID=4236 RepID=A0A9R1UGB7_LACSA|nr:hypothetical protein LSAT_V11C900485660 [Lactuca sativa]
MSRFKHHLAHTCNNVMPCDNVRENVWLKFCWLLEENDMLTKKKRGAFLATVNDEVQSTMNSIFKKEERERVCQEISRFFYISVVPFNCVKIYEFQKVIEMVDEFGRGLNPLSYHEIQVTMLKKEVDYTKSLMEDYKNDPRGTIFLAAIDSSYIIKMEEKVFAMLDDFVDKISEENVVQVVTDNASREMLIQKRKKLFWTPCATHCIDLMLGDFEKNIEEHKVAITKGRKITSFIYNRLQLVMTNLFVERATRLQKGKSFLGLEQQDLSHLILQLSNKVTKGKELLRPGATRFVASYLTVGHLFELKGALISFFPSEKWLSTKYARNNTEIYVEDIVMDTAGFSSSAITCLRAAEPLMTVLRLVGSDSKPAMGFIYQALVNEKKEIKENFKDIQTRYGTIDDRWYNQMNRAKHVAAMISRKMVGSKGGFYMCLERMCGTDENLTKIIDCQFDQFTNARGFFGFNVAKLIMKEKYPVDWWDSYGDDTPELKFFAMRILS